MRRALLRSVLALAVGVGLSACGFQLRSSQPMAFESAQLTGFAGNSPMAKELARALDASGVRVVDSTLAATQAASAAGNGGTAVPITHIVIDGMRDKRNMVVSTTTAYGQVRTFTVRSSLRFEVRRADGSILLPPTDIGLSRDLSYNETNALAKDEETAAMQRAMQSDIVAQVMRRLAAIRPDQLPTPPAPPKAPTPTTLTE